MPLAKYGQYMMGDYRPLCLVLAVFLYGVFGSPTPDSPGFLEALIFVLLVLVVGVKGARQVFLNFFLSTRHSKWHLALLVLFLYGVSIPVLTGLYYNSSPSVMLRDIVGFIFLCLPLLFVPIVLRGREYYHLFFVGALFVGLFFSIRVLFLDFSFFSKREELLYLANSPLVLFCALYFLNRALQNLKNILNPQNFIITIGMMVLAVLPMAAMYVDFQRASFLALGVSILIIFGFGLTKSPLKMLWPLTVLGVVGVILSPQLIDIMESISVKTSQVGLNMRYQEWMAVWQAAMESPRTLFLGHGWGAEYASPAVGGLNVSYTHSLITYMLLKTGLVGLGLTLVYLFFIFEKVGRLVFIEPVKGNALIWSFMIPILLYASYKSLDYGLILTLILVMDVQVRAQSRAKEDYISKVNE